MDTCAILKLFELKKFPSDKFFSTVFSPIWSLSMEKDTLIITEVWLKNNGVLVKNLILRIVLG